MYNVLDDIMIKQSKALGHLLSPQCESHFTVHTLSPFEPYRSARQLCA